MNRDQELKYEYTASTDQEGLRLDQFLAGELQEQSRSYIQKLIREERAKVNGKLAKASLKIHVDDQIEFILPPLKEPWQQYCW